MVFHSPKTVGVILMQTFGKRCPLDEHNQISLLIHAVMVGFVEGPTISLFNLLSNLIYHKNSVCLFIAYFSLCMCIDNSFFVIYLVSFVVYIPKTYRPFVDQSLILREAFLPDTYMNHFNGLLSMWRNRGSDKV